MKFKLNFFIKSSIYLMALRSPLIILTMAFYIIRKEGMAKKVIVEILPFVFFICLAMVYSVNKGNDIDNVIGQARDVFLAVVVSIFLVSASLLSEDNRMLIYRTLKYCFVYIALAKIFILLFSVFTGIPMSDIISWLRDAWNIQMMSLGVEDTFLARLQIPLDSAVPFFLYFVTKELILTEKNKAKTIATFILLIISMLLTLSRAFWAETIIIIFLAVLIEASVSRVLKITIISAIILSILIVFTPVGDLVFKIIETRFNSDGANVSSDEERIWQNQGLLNAFEQMPILGHGIGYFVPDVIRSYTTPYLYESQSLSMLMTLGVFGSMVLLLLFVIMCVRTISLDTSKVRGYFIPVVFLGFWVFSGSVNPLLFGASGGTILFMIARFHSVYRQGDS
ncbi:O-antigen ligase [Gibbsiella quercinecans]|uniref:O-antigen ligase family protein n=1 Tax=Gibbsiella quercinecans TaxID=929813 RepID=UPI000EF27D92|nr:O-antigen ligase family protein [Gibbsiella quercinecans]RLM03731.1 O-antigen ligase [Gibbsiella quercinecans]